jgi:hypothetical protein
MLPSEKMLKKYKDILIYNVYLVNMTGELREYNIFANRTTFFDACKAIEEYKKR